MVAGSKKSLGQAIDAIIEALDGIEEVSQIVAIKAVCEQLNINISLGVRSDTNLRTDIPLETLDRTPIDISEPRKIVYDIRTLKNEKKPNSAVEMACLVAYYLEHYDPEKRAIITTKDIEKYFKQGDYPLPKVLNQVLIDAKGAGYFDSPKRSTYKLNPVGYNLVVHSLPRAEGEGKTVASKKLSKRKAEKKSRI